MSRLFFGACESQKRGPSRTHVCAMAWLKAIADGHPNFKARWSFATSLFIVILVMVYLLAGTTFAG